MTSFSPLFQEQNNQWSDSWTKFFTEQRIGDMVKRINASGKDSELIKFECQMKEKVYPLLFEAVDSSFKPSIIHGDLWSGNSGVVEDIPIIFDPSSYYAHNEMELGIMNMFGGYTKEFFDSYHEVIPKMEPYYEERIKCYELYHHLNRESLPLFWLLNDDPFSFVLLLNLYLLSLNLKMLSCSAVGTEEEPFKS